MARPLEFYPPADLRIALIAARERGDPFATAWFESMKRIRFPKGGGSTDPSGKYAWRAALDATRPEWEAAYEGRESPGVAVVAALVDAIDGGRSELPERYLDAA